MVTNSGLFLELYARSVVEARRQLVVRSFRGQVFEPRKERRRAFGPTDTPLSRGCATMASRIQRQEAHR
jgi:hypothetical protein